MITSTTTNLKAMLCKISLMMNQRITLLIKKKGEFLTLESISNRKRVFKSSLLKLSQLLTCKERSKKDIVWMRKRKGKER